MRERGKPVETSGILKPNEVVRNISAAAQRPSWGRDVRHCCFSMSAVFRGKLRDAIRTLARASLGGGRCGSEPTSQKQAT